MRLVPSRLAAHRSDPRPRRPKPPAINLGSAPERRGRFNSQLRELRSVLVRSTQAVRYLRRSKRLPRSSGGARSIWVAGWPGWVRGNPKPTNHCKGQQPSRSQLPALPFINCTPSRQRYPPCPRRLGPVAVGSACPAILPRLCMIKKHLSFRLCHCSGKKMNKFVPALKRYHGLRKSDYIQGANSAPWAVAQPTASICVPWWPYRKCPRWQQVNFRSTCTCNVCYQGLGWGNKTKLIQGSLFASRLTARAESLGVCPT